MGKRRYEWSGARELNPKDYTCKCGREISSKVGYSASLKEEGVRETTVYQYFCHSCGMLTFFDHEGTQIPGPRFGDDVDHISDDSVKKLYDEARDCMSTNAHTAAVLCCRKLLMHIAVSKGAVEGLKFIEYVEYLDRKNFIPSEGRGWVDHIRKTGNDANHEITIMKREDAEDLIDFLEMLLKLVYEFPERTRMRVNPPAETITTVT